MALAGASYAEVTMVKTQDFTSLDPSPDNFVLT